MKSRAKANKEIQRIGGRPSAALPMVIMVRLALALDFSLGSKVYPLYYCYCLLFFGHLIFLFQKLKGLHLFLYFKGLFYGNIKAILRQSWERLLRPYRPHSDSWQWRLIMVMMMLFLLFCLV